MAGRAGSVRKSQIPDRPSKPTVPSWPARAARLLRWAGALVPRRRSWRWVEGVVAVAVITGVVVLAWPSHPSRALPPARAKVYTAFDACLLTDADGVSGSGAAPVWSGMQAASGQTSGKVSFLPVLGPDTQADAVPFVNTLVQRRCDLVLAVGRSEVAAVLAQAPQFPKVRFVVVGAPSTSTSASPAPNVTVVPVGSASSVAAAVQGLVTQAADSVTTS